ncbi:MAG: glycerate kinase [Promethearchaeota archaeon]
MYIKNTTHLLPNELEESQLLLRKRGLKALEKAISAVKPNKLMGKSIKISGKTLIINNKEFNLESYNKIYIIGGGKATAEMALTLEKILSHIENIEYEGIINIPYNSLEYQIQEKSKISINYASHPIPDESGLNGTKSMIEIIEKSDKNDLIFCLISGGGSALLTLPKQGITLKDLQKINSILLESGMSIHEINTVRKHYSDLKGGNLAKKVYNASGATLISLIISDVVDNNLDSIASGPTVPDSTTFEDAIDVLKKYSILEKVPYSIKKTIINGKYNKILENPKSNDPCFKNVYNNLIGSIKSAVDEIIIYLNQQGFKIDYFSDDIIGEARKFGRLLNRIIMRKMNEYLEIKKLALIATGELTVTIQGKGIGGRNQEMLLSYLDHMRKREYDFKFLIIGVNLDGIEGNSDAMGAIVDNFTFYQMNKLNLDSKKYLKENNSNTFFKILSSEIITGPTGCNVNDLLLVLILK